MCMHHVKDAIEYLIGKVCICHEKGRSLPRVVLRYATAQDRIRLRTGKENAYVHISRDCNIIIQRKCYFQIK